MSDLAELVAKLESAPGESRELDALIYQAVRDPLWATEVDYTPRYTSSIRDALTLVPNGWWWTCGLCAVSGHVTIGPDYNGPYRERLLREFPEDKWHEGISVDLEPGGDIHRTCLAICIAALLVRSAA